jgi:Arabinose-binding domain of AraC transcription regulator, N-term
MKVRSFALLCHAVLMPANLDRALKHVLRGFGVFLDDIRAELSLHERDAVISVENLIGEPAARRFADETFLVMVHGLMCWLAGKRVHLLSASFAFPMPKHAHEYTVMYSEHLSFDAPSTAIRFDTRWIGSPVVRGPASVKVFLRTAPQTGFLKYKNESGHSARIRRHLRKFVGQEDCHDVLMARVARQVRDPRVLRLIRRFFEAGLGTGAPRAVALQVRG